MICNTLKFTMALKEIFRRTRDEVTREWRKLRNEELYGLYISLNITWGIRSRGRGRAGHVA